MAAATAAMRKNLPWWLHSVEAYEERIKAHLQAAFSSLGKQDGAGSSATAAGGGDVAAQRAVQVEQV